MTKVVLLDFNLEQKVNCTIRGDGRLTYKNKYKTENNAKCGASFSMFAGNVLASDQAQVNNINSIQNGEQNVHGDADEEKIAAICVTDKHQL